LISREGRETLVASVADEAVKGVMSSNVLSVRRKENGRRKDEGKRREENVLRAVLLLPRVRLLRPPYSRPSQRLV
jgi:hypothetical protein